MMEEDREQKRQRERERTKGSKKETQPDSQRVKDRESPKKRAVGPELGMMDDDLAGVFEVRTREPLWPSYLVSQP